MGKIILHLRADIGSDSKPYRDAAVAMMRFLEKPSPEECRQMYIEDGN
jgi:hypothetical protein